MKGLFFSFLFALALIIGSYALMMSAIGMPKQSKPAINTDLTNSMSQTSQQPTQTSPKPVGNRLSRIAMEQVIDCYGGKPVYLDPEKSRPLYPSCEQLLRIYQGQTSDPEEVLKLLSQDQKEH